MNEDETASSITTDTSRETIRTESRVVRTGEPSELERIRAELVGMFNKDKE